METKRYSFLKFLGIAGAVVLIIFGSIENISRTVRYWWNKAMK